MALTLCFKLNSFFYINSDINGDFRRKSPIFPTPIYLTPPRKGVGVPFGIGYLRRGREKLELWGYQMVEKVLR